jgi:hypothetical protein
MFATPTLAQIQDEPAISKLLHATFDKPEAPLTIAPIVVAGNHAIEPVKKLVLGRGI